jgi:YHS domain-containing protein
MKLPERETALLAAACSIFFLVAGAYALLPPVNADKNGVAIKGYDTVAYFTLNRPVKGDRRFAFTWNGATWLFSSKGHRELFVKNPQKYAPQYGGY